MEITERRRQKEAAALEPKAAPAHPEIAQVSSAPVTESAKEQVLPPAASAPKPVESLPKPPAQPIVSADAVIKPLILVVSLIIFFWAVSFKSLEPWVRFLENGLNDLVIYGSFLILKLLQGSCEVHGALLNTRYYQVSLQGDPTAFYSLEMLIAFAVLFVYFQKTSLSKRAAILISLVPLAIAVNILRVVTACGLALNYGAAVVDQYFYNVLAAGVYVLIVLGLLFLESLSSTD